MTRSQTRYYLLNNLWSKCVSFFFSSRRRHTRWTGDWSSDVCSSDLCVGVAGIALMALLGKANNDPLMREYFDLLQTKLPGYKTFMILTVTAQLVLGLLLLVGGIGLLNMQAWARWVSVAAALGLIGV